MALERTNVIDVDRKLFEHFSDCTPSVVVRLQMAVELDPFKLIGDTVEIKKIKPHRLRKLTNKEPAGGIASLPAPVPPLAFFDERAAFVALVDCYVFCTPTQWGRMRSKDLSTQGKTQFRSWDAIVMSNIKLSMMLRVFFGAKRRQTGFWVQRSA